MKAIINSICIGTLALAVTAWGAQVKVEEKVNAKAKATKSASVQTRSYGHANANAGQIRTRQSFSAGTRLHQPSFSTNRSAYVKQHTTTNLNSNARVLARERKFSTNNEFRTRNYVATKRDRNLTTFNHDRNFNVNSGSTITTNRSRNFTTARGSNFTVNRDSNFRFNRNRNVAVTNNWSGSQFSGQNYSAFRNYSRTYHNRYWYESNCPRITFYFGAPYYWNSGYWYPAWGYYPDYVYEYDGPIYGYNGLAPDQVVLDVQVRLQREGYYVGPIDGLLGPMTRQAITAYQSDHGLAITSTIDQPTLATLGLS